MGGVGAGLWENEEFGFDCVELISSMRHSGGVLLSLCKASVKGWRNTWKQEARGGGGGASGVACVTHVAENGLVSDAA